MPSFSRFSVHSALDPKGGGAHNPFLHANDPHPATLDCIPLVSRAGADWRPIPFWVLLLLFGVATATFFLRRMQGDVTSRALLVSAWFRCLPR